MIIMDKILAAKSRMEPSINLSPVELFLLLDEISNSVIIKKDNLSICKQAILMKRWSIAKVTMPALFYGVKLILEVSKDDDV